jgi:threonine dehydrogenase-like Zn-dependent dehydrogenase
MRAVVLNAPGDISIVDQEVDASFERIAKLRVISSGLCAADKYLWTGKHPWNINYPIVPGHEIFGEIIEIIPEMKEEFPKGSKVSVQVNVPCGVCEMCKFQKFNMCLERRHFGSTFKGSFAEEIAIPSGSRIQILPDSIDDAIGGLSETMANAIYCAEKVSLQGDESVLILGMGSIGASLSHYLKKTYPKLSITVLTSSKEKQALFEARGFHVAMLKDAQKFSNNFQVVFETSGYSDNFKAGISAVKPNGIVMLYGVFRDEINFDLNQISEFKEITILGGHLANDRAFKASALFLSQNQEELRYLISNVVNFDSFTTAFANPKFSEFKTIFQPNHSLGAIHGF